MGDVVAVLLAGGRGTRMGSPIPKQEMEIDGLPLYRITTERFDRFACVDHILFVAPHGRSSLYQKKLRGLSKVREVIEGGNERYDSVWNALEALAQDKPEIVLIHDVVRPFVSEAAVSLVVRIAVEHGAAVVAARAIDTLYEVHDGTVTAIPDRSLIWHAQTPQGFRYDILRTAHERFRRRGGNTTDDVRLVIQTGVSVRIVEESLTNMKVTHPLDMVVAASLYRHLKQQEYHGHHPA